MAAIYRSNKYKVSGEDSFERKHFGRVFGKIPFLCFDIICANFILGAVPLGGNDLGWRVSFLISPPLQLANCHLDNICQCLKCLQCCNNCCNNLGGK